MGTQAEVLIEFPTGVGVRGLLGLSRLWIFPGDFWVFSSVALGATCCWMLDNTFELDGFTFIFYPRFWNRPGFYHQCAKSGLNRIVLSSRPFAVERLCEIILGF